MKTLTILLRCFIHLLCFLIGSLVDSSSLPSYPPSINCTVGTQAVLPCSWKRRLGEVVLPDCHIQWKNPAKTVFEQLGERKFEGLRFKGRLAVPEDRLESGDCSLVISDVQIGDMGRYESYMVVDGVRATKTKVFIQSVKLSVIEHTAFPSQAPGEDFVLQLHTHHSDRVIFRSRNCSDWSDLWKRGDSDSHRLEKHPEREQLTIKNLKSSDEGIYQVLDEHGLVVSTVQLSVEEGSQSPEVNQRLENKAATGGAAKISCSAFLLLSVLVTSLQILHLS
uniref:galectin 17 n=1 Tax=Semicossyphus pulcher TaxID=241346 RepID=UPI0037E7CEF6